MTIHVLVEGPSEKAFLDAWAPRLLGGTPIKVHPHQGKGRLPADITRPPDPKRRGVLDQLPAKVRAFRGALQRREHALLVLIDTDDEDPDVLRSQIQQAIDMVAGDAPTCVHLAIEETEAFYLGDLSALRKAFPDADMAQAQKYIPDSICGTAELFGRIVGDNGNNKVAWAEAMGPVITTQKAQSRSNSFKGLIDALKSLVPSPPVVKKRKPYRHPRNKKADPSRRR